MEYCNAVADIRSHAFPEMVNLNPNPPAPIVDEAAAANAIRDLCQKTEPEALWEALEAKGIETTPGVIYQVFNKQKDSDPFSVPTSNGKGLTPEDLSALGALAAKVGGMEQLIHILEVCQQSPN